MFPKVTTNPLDMERQVREYMDGKTAEEWYEGYLCEEAFLGSYCNGLIWLRKLSSYILIHELTHHFIELFKRQVNSNKSDIFHYLNELPNAIIQKNYYVFYEAIKEIRKLLN